MAIEGGINRRGLFSGAAAALVGGKLGLGPSRVRAHGFEARLVSAARIGDSDAGGVLEAEGLAVFALPARGHGFTRLPDGRVLLVARRPGTFAAILDPGAPERTAQWLAPIAGHRFAGHAAVSPEGRLLATSEIDAETGQGAIVPRDWETGQPLGRFPVGIEPHDVLFAQEGARLVVAVGGIARAADVKGPAMNAGNIDSALVELDPVSGRVIMRHVLQSAMKSLSLRHLALAPDGKTVAFGMQDQDRSELRPVMGLLSLGRGIELLPLPADDEGALRSYIGSVAIEGSGAYVAATSPKGGLAGLWRMSDGRWLDGFKQQDVCGLAAGEDGGSFWVTSGLGDVVKLGTGDTGFTVSGQWQAPAAFDNHLLRL
jgi:uncharacterized protein